MRLAAMNSYIALMVHVFKRHFKRVGDDEKSLVLAWNNYQVPPLLQS